MYQSFTEVELVPNRVTFTKRDKNGWNVLRERHYQPTNSSLKRVIGLLVKWEFYGLSMRLLVPRE